MSIEDVKELVSFTVVNGKAIYLIKMIIFINIKDGIKNQRTIRGGNT